MIVVTRRAFLAGTSTLALAGLMPLAARAATPKTYRALLVACADYPTLPQKYWLIGPKNDAVLVRDFLSTNVPPEVAFKPENVTILADEIEGAGGEPTREEILKALADLAAKSEQGDFVYLHLSGHGAQQPETATGDETDGFDEIFLPKDIGKWADKTKGVPNALVDNDIGGAIDAIRAKGAFVWCIFDCCHSGTATRAAEIVEEADRKVEFSDMVDDSAKEEAGRVYAAAESVSASRGVGDEPNERKAGLSLPNPTGAESIARGGLVAFYAAQSIETTPEMPLPKGTEGALRYGLFTYTIFSKIAENPYATYRQIGQAVLQDYTAQGRTRPTPLFEGDLDARIFGTEQVERGQQWPIVVKEGVATISGGLLHRLSPGSKLAVLAQANFETDKAVGYVEVKSAKNLESVVTPVAYNDMPALPLDQLPVGGYARVAELAVDYKLAVARPGPSEGLDAEVALVNALLDEVNANPDKRFNIELVEPGKSADLRLAVLRENAVAGGPADATDQPALWFLPASGDVSLKDGSRPPLVVIHADDKKRTGDNVAKNLTTIFRATSLSRLAAASDYRPEDVNVEFRIRRQVSDTMEPLVASAVPRVMPGDEVHVVAKNTSTKLVDINVLYVGSDYSVTHIIAERLVQGAEMEEGLLAFTDTSYGMERMIAVLTEAPPNSEMEDLSFLAQDGVRQVTRAAGGAAGFSDMLADIGLAPATRAAMKLAGKDAGNKGAVMIFPLETVPRA